jgi:predicted Zn-dependent protease
VNRLLTIIGFCVAICLLAACSSAPKQSKVTEQFETVGQTPELEFVDVYLLPLDDFDYRMADRLARILEEDLKLRVKATVNVGAGGAEKINNGSQYSAESLLKVAGQASASLEEKTDESVYVLLTGRDINSSVGSLRFLFSQNDRQKTAVLSTARLAIGLQNDAAGRELFGNRCFKMIKRQIGELYFGSPRSTDISDVMFAPIMSLETVDKMGTEFKGHPESDKKRIDGWKRAGR